MILTLYTLDPILCNAKINTATNSLQILRIKTKKIRAQAELSNRKYYSYF